MKASIRVGCLRGGLSVYLDLVRFIAAIGVVLSHAATYILPAIPLRIAVNGPECVAIFFVLSGFVIRFASVEKGETNWRAYMTARSARMYSVTLLALAVTFIIDFTRMAVNPVATGEIGGLKEAFINIFFLNQLWFTNTAFGSNGPYWSLGFEVPYYLFFAVLSFAPRHYKFFGIVIWALIFGPKIVAFLPLWYMGVILYDFLTKREPISAVAGALLIASSLVLYIGVKFGVHHTLHRMYRPTSYLDLFLGVVYFHTIGLAVALNFAGVDAVIKNRKVWGVKTARTIRWLANASFTIYLVHAPMLALARDTIPAIRQHSGQGALALLVILLCCFLLAEFGERRKRLFRTIATKVFSPPPSDRALAA